ncbi:MAG: hypothetical protein M1813_005280 [Trichoglossum hirsutum]|nr:MAG: hypothetical protein M1813_005280 [Trichoglossum hirsutum]
MPALSSPVSPKPQYLLRDPSEINKKIFHHFVDGPNRLYATFPPTVATTQVLGHLTDWSAAKYSRDIGRSSVFGGLVYYQFGDTFCKNLEDEFVGLVSNTIAVLTTTKGPLYSKYEDVAPNGLVDQFIPFNLQDLKFNGEYEAEKKRIAIWSFGGIVEVSPGSGVLWYERGEVQEGGLCSHRGTGIARVQIEERQKGEFRPVCHLLHDRVFGPDEIHWGAFSALLDDDGYIYLYGNHNFEIYIGRVRARHPEIKGAYARSAYEYFDGEKFSKDLSCVKPIMSGYAQGGVFKSKLFHPSHNANYFFVGCNNFADSKIIMGWAGTPQGPWEFTHIADAVDVGGPEGYKYTMYPHPWAFEESQGELMVTWSEHWPGGVVAAKLVFEMEDKLHSPIDKDAPSKYSALYFINDLPVDIRLYVSTLQGVIKKLVGSSLNIEQRGVLYPAQVEPMQWQPQKLHLVVESVNEKAVGDAIEFLDRTISKRQKARADRIVVQTAKLKSACLRARFFAWGRSVVEVFSRKVGEDEPELMTPRTLPYVRYVKDGNIETGVAPAMTES